MAVNASPFGPKPQWEDANGNPAVGYQLFTYVAGSTSTKLNTYTDSTGGSANTNPIVLNSLGQPTTQIWLTAGQSYKFVLAPPTDSDPPVAPIWTVDNLTGINDTSVTFDQWIASGLTPTFVSATQFTLAGDQTSNFHVGRRVKSSVTAGTSYGTITGSAFGALTTVTVDTTGSNPLDSGLSAVSYGLLSKTNDAMPRGIFLTVPNIRSYLSGLTLSTAGSSTTMSIAAGVANDSTNAACITLASAISKTTASWAVGTGNGGIDTGAIANSTWYHFYLIVRPDTSVVDVVFSTNPTTPTLPANYTLYRRIGSGLTNGSAQWTAFVQTGDLFEWLAQAADVNTTNPGAAAVLATLAVPTGVKVRAWFSGLYVYGTTTNGALLFSDPAVTDNVPSTTVYYSLVGALAAANGLTAGDFVILTNTSGQVRYRLSASGASDQVRMSAKGWYDTRGRDA